LGVFCVFVANLVEKKGKKPFGGLQNLGNLPKLCLALLRKVFTVEFRSGAVVKKNLNTKLAHDIDFRWLGDFYFILFEATKLQDEHSHTFAGL